ncbi:hypothetical protein R1flu_004290 [Riccia fluitans]|uniref:riboflavin kinase n=1 Tax=Riccia fluitans TaxID=41844 RepID=A0ABD1YQE3_9MARC
MEAYILSPGKSELSITASSNFSSVLLSVQRPLIAAPSSTFQSSKIHSRFCRRPQGDRRGREKSVSFISKAHERNRIRTLNVNEIETTRNSRETQFWRKLSTCCVACVTAPNVFKGDVGDGEEQFERVEKFYDIHGFLFDEENWDLNGSRSSDDYLGAVIAAAGVGDGSSVLSWGGSPELIRRLSATCSGSLVVSHCSISLLAAVKESNDDVICWHGNLVEMPGCSYGPFDSVVLNSLPVLYSSPRELLQSATGLCKNGARIIISNPEGKGRLAAYQERCPDIVLHDFPDLPNLKETIAGLPLKITEYRDDSFFLAALEVTEQAVQSDLNRNEGDSTLNAPEMRSSRAFALVPNYPLRVRGHTVKGFGRGSKQMGIPTANVDPEEVPEHVLRLPKGVYCGWAQVNGETLDKGVHKMVMNIGNRPTFADGGGISVEVHILHDYGDVYFYGEQLSLLVVGFIREEMQFKSIGELVQRIQADIETARKGLDEEDMQKFVSDEVFSSR